MTFSTSQQVKQAVAIIAGAIALSNLFMLFVAEGGGFWFLLLVTMLLFYITIAALQFKNSVEINKSTGLIRKQFGTVGFMSNKTFPLNQVRSVGIVTAARSRSGGGATTVYSVDLVGTSHLTLPGGSSDQAEVVSQGKRVADYLDLPFDPEPKMGFFGKRL